MPVPGSAARGRFHCEAGVRAYRLYVPTTQIRGLVVMLHGCRQDADAFARATNMDWVAGGEGLAVLYPEQAHDQNVFGCWNWFRTRNQSRGQGEPAIVAEMTRAVLARLGAGRGRVFVAGFSAGAAMALVLRDTYPDLYKAAGAHSGVGHGAARNGFDARLVMGGDLSGAAPWCEQGGIGAGRPVILFHGADDEIVHPDNATWIRDHIDPGLRRHPDVTVRLVEGRGHAWFGGSPETAYTDAREPDASREMVHFFLAHAAWWRRAIRWLRRRARSFAS